MIELENKKILFIGTGFFDFDDAIIEEIEKRGATVFYFSSALTSFKRRLSIRLGYPKDSTVFVSKRLMKLLNEQPKDVDYIFIVKADCFRIEHIEFLKKKYPSIPIVLYLWDSLEWLQNKDLLLKNFSIIYTFDQKDAEKYNLRFRPLFFRNNPVPQNENPQYDLSFVGSWHTNRYSFLRKIIPQLKTHGLKYKFVLRGGSFSIFIGKNITRRINKEDAKMFISNPISYNDYLSLCMDSRVILDIANPVQTGLTMRTIEMLGMKKKLLTTNSNIVHYKIDPRCYSIIDLENPKVDFDFISRQDVSENDLASFTLKSFIDEVLGAFEE